MGKRFLCALLTASLMMSGIPAQALSARAQGLDTETESALYEMEVGESSAVDETESDGSAEVSTESREEQSSTTGESISSEIEMNRSRLLEVEVTHRKQKIFLNVKSL